MRGRVDVSEGGRPAPPFIPSSNLIQHFDYGLGLSRLLQVKERAPTPTLGSEIVPVIICDDLKESAFPPRRWCVGASNAIGVAGQTSWVGVNCRGQVPSGNVNDRLVIHYILIVHNESGPLIMQFEIGTGSGVIGLSGGFALICDSTADQPTVGGRRSDFTGILFGTSTDATAATAQAFLVPNNERYRIDGPFIIGQGEGIFVHTNTPPTVGSLLSGFFMCEEFPRP